MSHRYKILASALLAGVLGASAPVLAQETEPQTPPPPPEWQQQQAPPQPQQAPARSGWRKFSESNPQYAPAPPQAPYGPPDRLVLPAGTWVTIRVNEPISSSHAVTGQAFTATLERPLVANGYVIARRGQTVEGRVTEVQKGRTSRLGLEITEIGLVDGRQLPVNTQLIEFRAGSNAGRNAAVVATGTGVGAGIGAIADGGFGAGMGAIAGAAASVIGVLATPGRATEVYPEAALTFKTLGPLTVSTYQSAQAFQPVQQSDYQSQRTIERRTARVAPMPMYGGWGWGYPYAYPYYYPGYYWGPTVGIGIYRGGYYRGRRW